MGCMSIMLLHTMEFAVINIEMDPNIVKLSPFDCVECDIEYYD